MANSSCLFLHACMCQGLYMHNLSSPVHLKESGDAPFANEETWAGQACPMGTVPLPQASTVGEPSPPLSPKGKEGGTAKPAEGAYVEGTI